MVTTKWGGAQCGTSTENRRAYPFNSAISLRDVDPTDVNIYRQKGDVYKDIQCSTAVTAKVGNPLDRY